MLSQHAGMSKPTMHYHVSERDIRHNTNEIQIYLTEAKKQEILKFCTYLINTMRTCDSNYRYNDIKNLLHLD